MNGHFPVIGCLAALVIFSACLSGKTNLVKGGQLTIETQAPERISMSVTNVYEENADVEILGIVWWQRNSPANLSRAHVDVEVVRPYEPVFFEYDVPLRQLFVFRRSRHFARFSGRLTTHVVDGTIIRLIFHEGVRHMPAGEKEQGAPVPAKGLY